MYEPVYGNFVGLVINDQDPEYRGRLQIYVPHITNTLYTDWNERVGQSDVEDISFRTLEVGIFSEDLIKRLRNVLPWAEAAIPIFGGGTSGFVSEDTYKATTVPEGVIGDGSVGSGVTEEQRAEVAAATEGGTDFVDADGDGVEDVDASGLDIAPEPPDVGPETVATPASVASGSVQGANKVADDADAAANDADVPLPDLVPESGGSTETDSASGVPGDDDRFYRDLYGDTASVAVDDASSSKPFAAGGRMYQPSRTEPDTHEKGFFSQPVVGAKVWVFFYGGDIQRPVYFASVLESNSYAASYQPTYYEETGSSEGGSGSGSGGGGGGGDVSGLPPVEPDLPVE